MIHAREPVGPELEATRFGYYTTYYLLVFCSPHQAMIRARRRKLRM